MLIIVTPEAEKHFNKLPRIEQTKIKKKLLILEVNPRAGKKLLGNFSDLWSLKAWPCRIIYFINKSQEKTYIITIVHRQGIYR